MHSVVKTPSRVALVDEHLLQMREDLVRRHAGEHERAPRDAQATPTAASSGPCPETSPTTACTRPSGTSTAS